MSDPKQPTTEIAALRAAADAIRKSAHVNSPEQAARFLEGRAEALARVAEAEPDWSQPCPPERR